MHEYLEDFNAGLGSTALCVSLGLLVSSVVLLLATLALEALAHAEATPIGTAALDSLSRWGLGALAVLSIIFVARLYAHGRKLDERRMSGQWRP